jgi:hypothetical protein
VVTRKWPLNWVSKEMTQAQLSMGISLIIISSTLPKADCSYYRQTCGMQGVMSALYVWM